MKPRTTRPRFATAPAPEPSPAKRRIQLPELFGSRTEAASAPVAPDAPPPRCVLLVTRSPALKDFLALILEREKCRVLVASSRDELEEMLGGHTVDNVLVAQDSLDDFTEWVSDGVTVMVGTEVNVLSSVSAQLLDNPVPYTSMMRTVLAAVQQNVEEQLAGEDGFAPYGLVARDVRDLSKMMGLRRMAADATQIAAWLLRPAPPGSSSLLHEMPATLDRARALHFPWRIDTMLECMNGLFDGRVSLGSAEALRDETNLAAQILALAWLRHAFREPTAPDQPEDVKGRLRAASGRLATQDVVESYIRLIESGGATGDTTSKGRAVVVTLADEFAREMARRFARLGVSMERVARTTDARLACERTPATAVIVDFTSLGMEAAHASVLLRLLPDLRLYAYIDMNDPSVTLDLIDAGFDDVITSPRDLDVLAARINREARRTRTADSHAGSAPGFRGTFAALSFVDLVQSLSQSRKSVRIDLDRGDGEPGVVFLEGGLLVHARAGSIQGVDAVYQFIFWGDEGRFAVESVTSFPKRNVSLPTEAVLMEGCRLYDESRA